MVAVTRSATVPVPQLTLRDDGAVREGTARAAALLGVESPQALVGATLASLLGARAAAAVLAHLRAGEGDVCDVVVRRRDGSAAALGFAAFARGPEGTTVHLSEPLCPGAGAYAEVVSASLAEAAHGLRNALAAARTSVDLVQRGIASPEDLPALHRVTRNSLARMDAMLSGLQEIARAQRGPSTAAEVSAVMRDAVARTRTHAASRGVTVTSRGASPTPPLRADVAGLVSALEALLLNAIDASAEGDEVSLSSTWHAAARELHLVVTDHGEGIPPERAPNVSRAFYSTRQGPGVGISVARSVAAAHGGEVSLCCPPEGGTVATLRLSAGAFAAR